MTSIEPDSDYEEFDEKLIKNMLAAVEAGSEEILIKHQELDLLALIFDEYMNMKTDWLLAEFDEDQAKKFYAIFNPFFCIITAKLIAQSCLRNPLQYLADITEKDTDQ